VCLDNKRLLGEHVEIHTIYSVIVNGYEGYSKHPEVLRWRDHLGALWRRHATVAAEMQMRGMRHKSPLARLSAAMDDWPDVIEPVTIMQGKLAAKLALVR